ncbi:MAG: 2Fe-2S iron-sulfur cluster-binding protein, partial [Alphaproteobacteria bacterium]|nr:2Fe-2S iron-sulfur cluster-binding protein [Alphaproteobacteria bacterium]
MSQPTIRNEIILFINGAEHRIHGEDAFLPLAQYLRYKANLTGTKVVCAEGDCGACTVLMSRWNQDAWSSFQTLNSCIAPVYLFDLSSIVTIEGLGFAEELNEVQKKMREFHGGQCGYCTPGMVCSLSGLAESCHDSQKPITEKKVRNHLTGNLCRCTGYEPILSSALHLDLSQWKSLKDRYLTGLPIAPLQQFAMNEINIEAGQRKIH